MHVIVTGGAGFIGSNVCASYLHDGHRVTIIDSLQRPGTERNLGWLRTQAGPDQLAHAACDIRDGAWLESLIGAPDVDLVFHFAAQTAVTTSLIRPLDDLDINTRGTLNVLEAVRKSRATVPPLTVFTSTNKVYGSLTQHAIVEGESRFRFADPDLEAHGIAEDQPLDFHSPYGCSKGAADQYVHDYARVYDLRTVVFRMSCIYGPRQFGTEDQGWVAHFMLAAAAGRPLSIYGTGKQVRDLLYVDDLVRAFKLAATHADTTAGHVYNIGGGPANSISIWAELRPLLEDLAGRRLDASLHPWRPGDQPVYVTDTRRAAADFGWTPRVDLDTGLQHLWSWACELQGVSAPREPIVKFVGPLNGLAMPGPLASPSA